MQAQYKFFRDLANDDDEKFNELITFCKKFLNNTLHRPIIHINGPGSNGKSTLLEILRYITYPLTWQLNANMLMNHIHSQHLKYLIVHDSEECNIEQLISDLKHLTEANEPKTKFIIVSNINIPTDDLIFKERLIHLKMDTVFGNGPNQKKADYNIKEKMLQNKEQFVEFVLNYKMAYTDSDDSSEEEFISKKGKIDDKMNDEIDISICI